MPCTPILNHWWLCSKKKGISLPSAEAVKLRARIHEVARPKKAALTKAEVLDLYNRRAR
jgi:hypothetical protein